MNCIYGLYGYRRNREERRGGARLGAPALPSSWGQPGNRALKEHLDLDRTLAYWPWRLTLITDLPIQVSQIAFLSCHSYPNFLS